MSRAELDAAAAEHSRKLKTRRVADVIALLVAFGVGPIIGGLVASWVRTRLPYFWVLPWLVVCVLTGLGIAFLLCIVNQLTPREALALHDKLTRETEIDLVLLLGLALGIAIWFCSVVVGASVQWVWWISTGTRRAPTT